MIRLTKATSEAVSSLFDLAWNNKSMDGDTSQQRKLAQFAHQNNLKHLLPQQAHSTLHDENIPHKHEGIEDEDHQHPVTKAYNPIVIEGVITKAWGEPGKDCFIEGWLSTPDLDTQGDIVEPEAFMDSLDGFFARRAPTSFLHNGQTLPAGHLQKAAIVRGGKILKTVEHPTDAADFEHFPATGTGVYVRGVLNTPEVADAVRKGNVGGFSFIGNGKTYSPLGKKGHRYTEINPLIESTVAPYPINQNAVITVAKAFGLEPPANTHSQAADWQPQEEKLSLAANQTKGTMSKLEELLTQLLEEKTEPPVQKAEPVTLADIAKLLQESQKTTLDAVDTKIQKAMELVREEGAGSKAPVVKAVLPEENPLYPIVKKAEEGKELSEGELHLLNAATYTILSSGMSEGGDASISDWFKGVGGAN